MIDTFPAVLQRTEAWWNRTNTSPLTYLIFPRDNFRGFGKFAQPWMAPGIVNGWSNWTQELVLGQALEITCRTGDWSYVDQAIDLLEYYTEVTGHLGEGYPFLLPGLGPGCLAAFITDFFHYHEPTIWLELETPWEWDRLLALTPDHAAPFTACALEAVRRLVARLRDRVVFAMPDFSSPLDTLSSIRGSTNLLMDTLDCPENIRAVVPVLETMTHHYREKFLTMFGHNHGGFCYGMRYLSAKPTCLSICDFSAMISAETFHDLALPSIRRETEQFPGRTVYHMDGPRQIFHLPDLLKLPGLFAIQWVPGSGNPDCLDPQWDELYTRILDGGKRICFGGTSHDPDRLRRFLNRFPKQEFLLPFVCPSRQDAEQVLRLCQ